MPSKSCMARGLGELGLVVLLLANVGSATAELGRRSLGSAAGCLDLGANCNPATGSNAAGSVKCCAGISFCSASGKTGKNNAYKCAAVSAPCPVGLYYQSAAPTFTSDRGCMPVTICSADQYEAVAPTSLSDRLCHQVTKCAMDQFQASPPTWNADRVCAPVSPACHAGITFQSAAPTGTSDRICSPVSSCLAEEYEVSAPTALANRVCAKIRVACGVDEYESAAPTSISDRVCRLLTVCTESEFQSSAPQWNKDRGCSEHSVCNANEYEAVAAQWNADRKCAPVTAVCPTGTYSAADPTPTADRQCAPVTAVCPTGTYSAADPTPTADRQCAPVTAVCPTGTYSAADPTPTADRLCAPVTAVCPTGTYSAADPTPTADRQCAPVTAVCPTGTYSAADPTPTADRQCAPVTAVCPTGTYSAADPTPTADRQCAPVTAVCPTGTYSAADPTPTADRQCAPVTAVCPTGTYSAADPTPTADRQCQTCSECSAFQFVVTACSSTSDTVCTVQLDAPDRPETLYLDARALASHASQPAVVTSWADLDPARAATHVFTFTGGSNCSVTASASAPAVNMTGTCLGRLTLPAKTPLLNWGTSNTSEFTAVVLHRPRIPNAGSRQVLYMGNSTIGTNSAFIWYNQAVARIGVNAGASDVSATSLPAVNTWVLEFVTRTQTAGGRMVLSLHRRYATDTSFTSFTGNGSAAGYPVGFNEINLGRYWRLAPIYAPEEELGALMLYNRAIDGNTMDRVFAHYRDRMV